MSKLRVPEILETGAETYRERNAIYGDSWDTFRAVMMTLFPEGVHLENSDDVMIYNWIEHIIGKLVRFKNSKFKHRDSVHDISVYAAMIEAFVELKGKEKCEGPPLRRKKSPKPAKEKSPSKKRSKRRPPRP